MDKTAQPKISCHGIFLDEMKFSMSSTSYMRKMPVGVSSFDITFDYEYEIDSVHLAATLKSKVVFNDDPELDDIEIKVVGFFESDIENNDFLDFFAKNAAPSLVPYARMFLSTVTGWSAMPPIVLPPVNLTAAALEGIAGKPLHFTAMPVSSQPPTDSPELSG